MALQTLLMNLRQRFEALPANDRRALIVMVAAVFLTLVYLTLSSSRNYQQNAVSAYRDASENSRWITLNVPQIRSVLNENVQPDSGATGTPSDASLINRATTSAKPFGIVFKRFQPEGETGLRLWIEEGDFDQLMRWTAALERQQIQLDQLEVDKAGEDKPGVVEARVLLSLKP